jgi:hypothetical protein
VNRVSASELRLTCAVECVGPGAQHDRARFGGTPGENELLPGSLRARFTFASHVAPPSPLTSTRSIHGLTMPIPNLLRCTALDLLTGCWRDDGSERPPDRNCLSGVLPLRTARHTSAWWPRRSCFRNGHTGQPRCLCRSREPGEQTIFGWSGAPLSRTHCTSDGTRRGKSFTKPYRRSRGPRHDHKYFAWSRRSSLYRDARRPTTLDAPVGSIAATLMKA